ncbi:MAG: DMT family transporter [Hyphomicrobiales bacterium]|nr:DMT family transporter [Hyphomicrobiales bacterium]
MAQPNLRLAALTTLAMLAFAANSVLCRLALARTAIDPAAFTLARLACGAVVLLAIALFTGRARKIGGSWSGAAALFVYAAAFSFAYVSLPAGAGALLLFGAVQATMILYGLARGERMRALQWLGLGLALGGLVALLAPGASAPSPHGAALMLAAGAAWGVYSLIGRTAGDPFLATSGNFLRAAPMAAALALAFGFRHGLDMQGLYYAALSGGIASGLGYVIWYAALPGLSATQAASVQLSVPVIATIGGALLLGEAISSRQIGAALAILGGIALVIAMRKR